MPWLSFYYSVILNKAATLLPLLPRYSLSLAFTAVFCSIAVASESREINTCRADGDGWVCDSETVANSSASNTTKSSGRNQAEITAANNPFYWVPIEQIEPDTLTPEQQQYIDTGCCGAYLPPPAADLTPPAQADTHMLSHGRLHGDPNGKMHIDGGVTLTQGSRFVKADRVDLDETTSTTTITGDIEIRETGSVIVGDSASLNRQSGEARVENAQFILYDTRMRGAAGTLHRDADENITLSQGQFTQCEPGSEHWMIKGSEIFLDTEKEQGSAKHLRLELAGVPVFYFPYLTFPTGNKPKSGFLYPSISTDDIPLPYYITLAPNYDMTITPRYLSERGWSTEIEGRHLSRWFETTLGGAWLGNGKDEVSDNEQDAINENLITIAEATEFDGEDRWLALLQQEGGGENWRSTIDVTKVSDYSYFRHIDTANLDVNRSTYLRRLGEFTYQLPNWTMGARWEEFQNLVLNTAEPYKQIPRIDANAQYQWGDVALTLDNQWARFDHRDPTTNRVIGDRTRLDYELAWNKEWLWGFFKPAVLMQTLSYQLDDDYLSVATPDDNPTVTAPQATVDMGMFFERDGNWFGNAYLQTFEPRLFYFYSEYEDQSDLANVKFDTSELTFSYAQLFRNTRFAGKDRVDDANQVSVGLTTRFLGRESGMERLRLSLGQIYYFDDRQVTLDGTVDEAEESQVAGQISSQLTDSLRLTGDILYTPETQKTDKGSVSLRYFDDANRIVNLAYRYTRKPTAGTALAPIDTDESQVDLSVVWPLTSSLSLIARGYHDFTNDRALDTIAGLEYTSCCYRLRLVGRRWLDNELVEVVADQELVYDQGIFLEVQLRGLGLNIGNRLSSALNESILNYERREENLTGRP